MPNLPNALFLDTETTGLDSSAEIVEIAIIDAAGNVLLDTRVKPLGTMDPEAQAVHGISPADVENCPTFADLWSELCAIVNGKTVVMYGAGFDKRMLQQSAAAHQLDYRELRPSGIVCAMLEYAAYWGALDRRRGSYRWQKLTLACHQQGITLPEGMHAHSARADAELTRLLTLKVLAEATHGS